ncbi:MAG TPA: helicase HerA-like domain-containing protein [Polyangiaceae bacterium]|nr:helicase HerA-like domain-containing protein [Polyangiaceae bacterium]
MAKPVLSLGAWRHLSGVEGGRFLGLPAEHLVTHGVVVGMTGSGKTGLVTVLVEEAARARVPTVVIDVKGDLPNLLLAFPGFRAEALLPWIEGDSEGVSAEEAMARAHELAERRRAALGEWGIGEAELASYVQGTQVRVLTPGSSAGEALHMLSSLERRSSRWDSDPEAARDALTAAVSLVLRLLGREPDPAKSREHVLLSVLAERRLAAGLNAELGELMQDVLTPPIAEIGALSMDAFMKKTERRSLAAALNTLLASPSLASWRQGANLDVAEWLAPKQGQTPIVVVSVAHLDDEERALVLGVLLEEILSWVRTLPGSQRLRALVVFDEVYGFLPPHPANPPTKRPLVALMKQARGFGVGVVVATQNPMDLDYRALSNAGLWFLGRLQTDADRARVVEGLAAARGAEDGGGAEIETTLQRLAPRWFVVRNAHVQSPPILMQPRFAMTLMRGPMTRTEIRRARGYETTNWRAMGYDGARHEQTDLDPGGTERSRQDDIRS